MNAELLEKLKGLGMSVTTVDKQEVQSAIKPVWNTWMGRVGPEGQNLIRRVVEIK
jgi:TRAP-type C4-dicarboxylate transport system substrate-binding protein